MKKVAGTLKTDLAQYRELAAFAAFGSDLDKATQTRLNRGLRTLEILKQGVHQPLSVEKQVVSIYTVVRGHLDETPVQDIRRFEAEFLAFLDADRPEILQSIRDTKDLTSDNEKALKDAIQQFQRGFATTTV
jgi:F-type H+-transporting ATPase subunit alpha